MDIRESIEAKYRNLKQLEDYEELIERLNDKSRWHWWKIVTPDKETNISTYEARENLKKFIMTEIERIKNELGLYVEGE